jgi:hypothetical protein
VGIQLPVTKDQVLFKHKGIFDVFDINANEWLNQRTEETLRPRCTLRAEGLYAPLQMFLDNTNHSSNSVLASQSKCPIGVTLTEYNTFGQVRAGNRIQWLNIMRAIRTQSLPFSEPGVFALIVQSIWQAGPIGEVVEGGSLHREAHVDLLDEAFGNQVASELLRATRSVGSNWKEGGFLSLLILLALRLHAFSPHPIVRLRVRQLLGEARDLAMGWIKWLLNSPSPAKRVEVEKPVEERCDHKSQALATVALILRASFDVEEENYTQALQSRDDAERYIYAGILISAIQIESFPSCFRLLASRNHHLILKLEPHLIHACSRDPSILYSVGVRLWPELLPETKWTPVLSCRNHWWTSIQSTQKPSHSFILHMNIVEGIFLVNGRPLHQLPPDFRGDPLYRSLFSDFVRNFPSNSFILTVLFIQVFEDVGPSKIPGMEFRSFYKTYEVQQMEYAKPKLIYNTHEVCLIISLEDPANVLK